MTIENIIFIWNNKLNKYEEVHSEFYEYNGELALADIEDELDKGYQHEAPTDETPPAGTTPWRNTSNYGTEDWHPSYEQMVSWVEQDNLSTGDIAMGFGLDSDAGKYFPEPDFWKSAYLADEFELDQEKYDLAIQKALEVASNRICTFIPLHCHHIRSMTTSLHATPSKLLARAETSTFFTADSPLPSETLVNFITACLGPSISVCEVTASAISTSLEY